MIGIDRYAEWPRLENAVSDATAASRLFTQLGFMEVTAPLLDDAATAAAMHHLVTDDLAQLSRDDSLVLFFAGHGYTHTARFGDVAVKTGCVIPVDARHSRDHVSASWLRIDSWLSDIARLPPRHILVIVDACHSGVALSAAYRWRDQDLRSTTELDALQARRSRRIITSALDDERAMDCGPYTGHSLFTGCLIEGLSGGLAENGRRFATGSEIGQYVQKRVRSYPQSTQTPDFGAFELDDRGDIVVPILFQESSRDPSMPTGPAATMAPSESAPPNEVGAPAPLPAQRTLRDLIRPRSLREAVAVGAGIVIVSTGVGFGYKVAHDAMDRTSEAQVTRSLKPEQVPLPQSPLPSLQPSPPRHPSSPPPPPASQIAMNLPSPDEIKAPRAGVIETILRDKSSVKTRAVIAKLVGNKPIEDEIASLAHAKKRLEDRLKDPQVVAARAALQKMNAFDSAHGSEDPESGTVALLASHRKQLNTKTIELGNYLIKAPADGMFAAAVKPGQKIAAGDVVATVQRRAVPTAIFELADTTPFAVGASVDLTAGGGSLSVTCTLTEVRINRIMVVCPAESTLTADTYVALKLPALPRRRPNDDLFDVKH